MDATSSSPQRQPSIDPSTPFLSPACHLPDDGEEDEDEGLVEHFKAMDVKMDHKHFLGRSSNLMLIQTAMDLKQEYVASDSPEASKGPRPKATKPALSKRRPEFWEPMPVRHLRHHTTPVRSLALSSVAYSAQTHKYRVSGTWADD